jgi:hypothetical protein
MSHKIYHIYARGQCIYHSLKEEDFTTTWVALNRLSDLLSNTKELSYEEVTLDNELILNSSH